mgnify:CR=1 FL=1
MFYRFNFIQKVILLFLCYSVISIICSILFSVSLSFTNTFSIFLIQFIQSWNLMLIGFLFFQAFKYYRFPKIFYQAKKFETPLFYKLLGVNLYRSFLINSFFKYLNSRVYLRGRPKIYLQQFIEETKQSETSHIFSMICTSFVQLAYLNAKLWEHSFWLTFFSILLNLYPILLQRMNRLRILPKS